MNKLVLASAALLAVSGFAQNSFAAVSYTTAGSTYNQNFDTLASSNTGNAWTNDSTLVGWNLFRSPAPGTAITTYNAETGGTNTGTFASYGSIGSTERALGGQASGGAYFGSPAGGAVAGWIATNITNNTGGTLASATIGFRGEQWRNGGNATAQTMVLEYGFGSSFTTVSTWSAPGGNFNWTSPVATATATGLDGNVATNQVTGRGGTLSSLTWANGDTMWIRWIENNDAGNDHGLAIDDFSFSATAANAAPVFTNTPYAVTVDLGARSSDVAGSIGLSVTDTDASQTLTFGTGAFPVGFYGSSFSSPTLSTPVTNGATTFGFNVATYVPNGTYNLPVTVTDGVVGSPVTINVAVTVIPEPASLALLGGAAALLVTRRRR